MCSIQHRVRFANACGIPEKYFQATLRLIRACLVHLDTTKQVVRVLPTIFSHSTTTRFLRRNAEGARLPPASLRRSFIASRYNLRYATANRPLQDSIKHQIDLQHIHGRISQDAELRPICTFANNSTDFLLGFTGILSPKRST